MSTLAARPRRACRWAAVAALLICVAGAAPALRADTIGPLDAPEPSWSERLHVDDAAELVVRALDLLGVRYRFGGAHPESGVDCSGLVQWLFRQALAVDLPRTALAMSRLGTVVLPAELVIGDLVFFNTRGRPYTHIGIYIGEGRFVHASSTRREVVVDRLDAPYYRARFNGARRVI